MGALVVYSGKYGSTAEYASWIGEDLSAPVVSVKKAGRADIEAADTVVLGSSVQMGKLTMAAWLRRNWTSLASRRLILFTVSATPASEEARLRAVLANSLAPAMRGRMEWFPLPGRIVFSRLPAPLAWMLRKASERRTDPDKDVIKEFDAVERKNTAPVVEAARKGAPGGVLA